MTGTCGIEFETLVDCVENEIDGEARVRLELHMANGCAECHRNLTWLRRTIHLMRTDNSVSPPAWVFERARYLFKERQTKSRAALRKMVAALLFDSSKLLGLQPSLAGTRQGAAPSRQLLFGTGELDIDFLLEESSTYEGRSTSLSPSIRLWGQILPRGDFSERDMTCQITLSRGQEPIFSCRSSPLGEFTIDRLAPGTYDMHVSLENDELVIEGIEI